MVISSRLGLLEEPKKSTLKEMMKLTLVFTETKFQVEITIHAEAQRQETACLVRGALVVNEYEAKDLRFG